MYSSKQFIKIIFRVSSYLKFIITFPIPIPGNTFDHCYLGKALGPKTFGLTSNRYSLLSEDKSKDFFLFGRTVFFLSNNPIIDNIRYAEMDITKYLMVMNTCILRVLD